MKLTTPFFLILISVIILACESDYSKYKIQQEPVLDMEYFQSSLETIESSERNDPDNPEILYKKALLLHKLNKPDKAVSAIRKAIDLDKAKPEYYLLATQIYININDHNQALLAAKEAEKAGVNNVWLFSTLATISTEQGDSSLAFEYINKAIDADPANPASYFRKGNLFLSFKDTVAALESYNRSLKMDSNNYELLTILTDISLAQGQNINAKHLLTKKLSLFELDSKTRLQKGLFFMRTGLLDSALVEFKNIIKLDSGNYMAYYHSSRISFQKGQYDSAQFYAQRTIDLNPASKDAMLTLARVKDKKRQYYNSIQLYDKLIQMDTTFLIAQKERAIIQKKINNLAKIKQEERAPVLPTIQPKF